MKLTDLKQNMVVIISCADVKSEYVRENCHRQTGVVESWNATEVTVRVHMPKGNIGWFTFSPERLRSYLG